VLLKWGAAQYSRLKQAFSVGGHLLHGGAQWQPRKKERPWPLLVETGEMRNNGDVALSGLEVRLINADRKARWHQEGTKQGLPARPIVLLTEQDMEELKRNLVIELEFALRRM
jgi:phage gpG-like protein